MSTTTTPALLCGEAQQSIREQLAREQLWYALPEPVDALYEAHRQRLFASVLRVGWPLIIAMFFLILAGGWLQFREQMVGWDGHAWWGSAGFTLLLYGVGIPLLHHPRVSRRYVPAVSTLSVFLIASQLACAMLVKDQRFAQEISYVCMINNFSVMLGWRLPPVVGALICLAGLPLATAVAWYFGVSPDWSLVLTYHVGAIACLFMVALVLERAERLSFLQGLMLEHEAQERTRLNEKLDQQNRQLERLANEDALTGLCNRRHFDQQMAREWDRLRREQQPLAVLFIDVDHFKRYNDYYGHGGGDDCLAAVGHVLRAATRRPADLAARYGGEEFVVMLPGTDDDGARDVAQRILEHIDRLKMPHAASPVSEYLTVSIGFTATVPSALSNTLDLLKAADDALYAAKHAGRHRAVSATSVVAQPLWQPHDCC